MKTKEKSWIDDLGCKLNILLGLELLEVHGEEFLRENRSDRNFTKTEVLSQAIRLANDLRTSIEQQIEQQAENLNEN